MSILPSTVFIFLISGDKIMYNCMNNWDTTLVTYYSSDTPHFLTSKFPLWYHIKQGEPLKSVQAQGSLKDISIDLLYNMDTFLNTGTLKLSDSPLYFPLPTPGTQPSLFERQRCWASYACLGLSQGFALSFLSNWLITSRQEVALWVGGQAELRQSFSSCHLECLKW